jgi:hypothetical protein
MLRQALAVGVLCGLVGSAPSASTQEKADPGESLRKDAEAMQGTCERVGTTDDSVLGKAKRAMKEIKGDKETVTWYADDGKVIRSHRVTFKLSASGKVRIFTWSDMEILDGPNKGRKFTATGSYIYRLEKGELYETNGFLQGDPAYFALAKWKKAAAKK